MNFSEQIIEKIKEANNIVDVIGTDVILKKSGANHKGLCPFHHEKTPSFIVSEEKQIFHCFGCGKGGNIFTYVMAHDGVDFVESVKILAERAGIVLDEEDMEKHQQEQRKKEKLFALNQAAADFFKAAFFNSKEARKYAKKRDLTLEAIQQYHIGYAPAGWESLYTHLSNQGFEASDMIEVGLIAVSKKSKGHYDKFRNRLMFPILNLKGNIVGFGGRAIGGEEPKYLNSPDSIIFNKSNELYGLYQAKDHLRKQGALLVEGYMDVVSLNAKGYHQVVASLGTALTQEQAKLLKRHAEDIVICYDSDKPGRKACIRAFEVFRGQGISAKAIWYTSAKDPDELMKKSGRAIFEELLSKALSYVEYYIYYQKSIHVIEKPADQIEFAKEIVRFLKEKVDTLELEAYMDWIVKETRISKEAILGKLTGGGVKRVRPVKPPSDGAIPQRKGFDRRAIEVVLLQVLQSHSGQDPLILESVERILWSDVRFQKVAQGMLNQEKTETAVSILAQEGLSNPIHLPQDLAQQRSMCYDCLIKLLEHTVILLKEDAAILRKEEFILKVQNIEKKTKVLKLPQECSSEKMEMLKRERLQAMNEVVSQLMDLIKTFGRSDLLGGEIK